MRKRRVRAKAAQVVFFVQYAIDEGTPCANARFLVYDAVSALGTALAKSLLRHRASCLPYAPLASRETPRVRLDRTQFVPPDSAQKPDLPPIDLAGMSGFFYSWERSECTTTNAV
ncbi:N-acetyl-gamma-glutamylphosphate reductase [Pseudomonas syringae pv. actinidiae]|uniref:N-acetyl-gamma-glutamylphosphate reductase n=1 Tax=Pseudomonas syringae pv. actinidiae TaxID=103796 RepID=A0AAN4Q6S2_PSESF|nr:N-acetyl-gamma-glutamylphosphate reductase [Pseudomonas syringae pv. actinidiae]